ncbi:DNRLRE domain-containing protein [Massilia sp. IC2-477]|uniref:DNRLRE domain-containing protein n=1 Tax=Massilia sp. IC2-477 TaxID=2887198 RepID=UPI001D11F76F|nr:DNRLRE domain-containing protein [Massilia sp. IC2-477]MCC2954873.1 DNRLRE domain-containing protein [Massilia sp. IC2-477]
MKRERGLLLLPVALALSVMGMLAYAMARGSADEVAAIDAEYDVEATRYLAEAGLRLAKWQNERVGCGNPKAFGTVRLKGVPGELRAIDVELDKGEFEATVRAESPRGTVSTVTLDKMPFYDRTQQYDTVLPNSAFRDTTISSVSPNAPDNTPESLEATDAKAHFLLSVALESFPTKARVTKATLWLYLDSSNSVQTVRELAAHAVTRAWTEGTATWNSPWNTSPGGSYEARPEAVTAIAGTNRFYRWDIGPLVRRWHGGALANFGMLFKPSGLNRAIFRSREAGNNRPRMDVSYNLRCD